MKNLCPLKGSIYIQGTCGKGSFVDLVGSDLTYCRIRTKRTISGSGQKGPYPDPDKKDHIRIRTKRTISGSGKQGPYPDPDKKDHIRIRPSMYLNISPYRLEWEQAYTTRNNVVNVLVKKIKILFLNNVHYYKKFWSSENWLFCCLFYGWHMLDNFSPVSCDKCMLNTKGGMKYWGYSIEEG